LIVVFINCLLGIGYNRTASNQNFFFNLEVELGQYFGYRKVKFLVLGKFIGA